MEIAFFYRKRRANMFSIESLFDNLSQKIYSYSIFNTRRVEVRTIRNIFMNTVQAFTRQSDVNHVTGDIHYVSLGMRKKKTVLTIHDCVFTTKYSKWHPKYWLIKFFWYQLPVHFAHTITTISEKTKNELVKLTGVNPDKVHVIPNFFDPRLELKRKEFNQTEPRILHIGSKPNKNLLNIIKALKGIKCHLDIVGHLDEATHTILEQNKINYSSSSNLSFEEMKLKYELSDMVVFISTYEGFGMPVIEANKVGRPVVTSNISPMKEIAGDAACKVNPYNILDIRRGILKVIQDAHYREQLVQNGIANCERFNIDNIAKQYVEVYKTLAS